MAPTNTPTISLIVRSFSLAKGLQSWKNRVALRMQVMKAVHCTDIVYRSREMLLAQLATSPAS